MSDKYVDEIRAIRQRQYEETKDMTWDERQKYTLEKAERVRRQIEELKAQKETPQLEKSDRK